jgi:hypothetical protein
MVKKIKGKRGRGRPALTGDDKPAGTVAMKINRGFAARVDKWRATQADKPSRGGAIRTLAESALSAAGF